jgi:hypothetical protein
VGSLTSHNPIGLQWPVTRISLLFFYPLFVPWHKGLLICIHLIAVPSTGEDISEGVTAVSNVSVLGEQKLSEQVRLILDHYKQDDPVGLPGAPISDPMPIPDMKHSFTYATMHFKSAHVHGLSRFRIQHVRSDLAALQVGDLLPVLLLIQGGIVADRWNC